MSGCVEWELGGKRLLLAGEALSSKSSTATRGVVDNVEEGDEGAERGYGIWILDLEPP